MNIIAHRGASSYAPENTLAAFEKAMEKQADGIELDVRLSKDGVPVISHDASINRMSNGKGYIHQLTVEKMKQYDFGSRFDRRFKQETIPTLEEVLQLIANSGLTIHLELKNGPVIPADLEKKVLELCYEYDVEDQVVFSSFDHMSLQRLATLAPNAKIGLLFHINLIHLFQYVDQTGLKVHSIHPNHFYVTDEMLRQAHDRNILVNLYTVNNIALAKTYRDMGVDGLMTNDPLLLT